MIIATETKLVCLEIVSHFYIYGKTAFYFICSCALIDLLDYNLHPPIFTSFLRPTCAKLSLSWKIQAAQFFANSQAPIIDY